MFKQLLLIAALIGGFSIGRAQSFPYPVDINLGQRWVNTSEAAFYFAARTYIPTNVSLFGVDIFAVPELGLDRDTLQPYARLELTLDSEYATAAAFVTRMGDSTRINLELRFCVLSPRCGE